MKFIFLPSYDEISPYVDGPFNAPEADRSGEGSAFEEEYEKVRNGLQILVVKFLHSCGMPESAINVGHRTGPSRGIALVVDEMIGGRILGLMEEVRNYLSGLPVDYCVPINVVIDEDSDFKDLNIVVTRSNQSFVHADNCEWFHEIGINPC